MNKKILIVGFLAALMLLTISFATVVNSNTTMTFKKKDSPLFGIRTRLAIGERLDKLKENIKAKFVGDRLFFLPFQWLRNKIYEDSMDSILVPCTSEMTICTCQIPCQTWEKTMCTCYPAC